MTDTNNPFDLESEDRLEENELLPVAPLTLNPEDFKEALGIDELSDEEITWLQAFWDIMTILVNMNIPVDKMDEALKQWFEECDSDSVNQQYDDQ